MIYICIPAYNEERTIGVLLWKIRQVLADFPRDYQILVANDGSSDDTAEVLGPYQRVLPLTVVQIEKRHGYANALELLVREAVRRAEYPKRDVIVTLQADFTDDPAELTPMLKRIEAGADVVCANVQIPDHAPRSVRWARKIGKFLLRRRGWPEGVTDPLSGLRAYRVQAVKRAIEARGPERLLTWDGWAANAELLQLVQPHARRTEAVDMGWREERHQRPSRLTFWSLVGLLNRFARGGVGPLAGVPLELAGSTVDLREERGQSYKGRQDSGAQRDRGREGQGRDRKPKREEGERGPRAQRDSRAPRREGSDRQGRTERPVRAEKPERSARPERGERAARPPRNKAVREQSSTVTSNGVENPDAVVAGEAIIAPQGPPAPKKKRRRRRRKPEGAAPGNGTAETPAAAENEGEPATAEAEGETAEAEGETTEPGQASSEQLATSGAPKKRRSRRGGRGRRGRRNGARNTEASTDNNDVSDALAEPPVSVEPPPAPSPENGSTN